VKQKTTTTAIPQRLIVSSKHKNRVYYDGPVGEDKALLLEFPRPARKVRVALVCDLGRNVIVLSFE